MEFLITGRVFQEYLNSNLFHPLSYLQHMILHNVTLIVDITFHNMVNNLDISGLR